MQESEHYFFDGEHLIIFDPEMEVDLSDRESFLAKKIFYPSGKLKMETYYKDETLHGPSTYWSEKGIELSKTWFFRGGREGKGVFRDLKGVLSSIQRFHRGVWEGRQEYFYPNGALKSILHFEGGVLKGEVRLFDSLGSSSR